MRSPRSVSVVRQRLSKLVPVAVKYTRNESIVESVVLYAVRDVSKKRWRLVLSRTACLKYIYIIYGRVIHMSFSILF
jgi:hypothetical protein